MITRRQLILGSATLVAAGAATGAYAGYIEPQVRLDVTSYRLTPPRWPAGLTLKIAVIADIHAAEPYMPAARIEQIVTTANALGADLTVVLGDFEATHRFVVAPVAREAWADTLGALKAPLGVYTILGNHDWWHHAPLVRAAIHRSRIPLLENDAVKLSHQGQSFWLAGIGDQIAHYISPGRFRGVDDLPGTLARVTDDAPVILLVHEPDIFPDVPERVSLTLAGHTHGGQVRIFGYSPVVPSGFGNRYAYGHVIEDGRHLIVSGGLGTSIAPVRLGVPPEILLVTLG